MESSSNIVQYTKVSAVSPETQAIVEQNLPHASDEVKRKTMELMDATKRQIIPILKSNQRLRRR